MMYAEHLVDGLIDDLREYVKTRIIANLETWYHWATHRDAPVEKWILEAIQAWLEQRNDTS